MGLILAVAISLLAITFFNVTDLTQWRQAKLDWNSLLVIGVVLGLDFKYQLNPIWLILIAGIIGAAGYYLA